MEPSDIDHAKIRERSYANLAVARSNAIRKFTYTERSRGLMQMEFTKRFGKPAYDWQLDVAEAILVNLDCVLIAGTGFGKTIPFMLPLLLDKQKLILVVSPLKILQQDQVCTPLGALFQRTYPGSL